MTSDCDHPNSHDTSELDMLTHWAHCAAHVIDVVGRLADEMHAGTVDMERIAAARAGWCECHIEAMWFVTLNREVGCTRPLHDIRDNAANITAAFLQTKRP